MRKSIQNNRKCCYVMLLVVLTDLSGDPSFTLEAQRETQVLSVLHSHLKRKEKVSFLGGEMKLYNLTDIPHGNILFLMPL